MKKIIILGILLASLIVLGGITNNKHPEQEIIKNENINLAIYLNDTKTNGIPSKEGNVFDEEKSTCTNDAYIVWDYSSWSPIIKNVSNYPVRCNLYFKTGYSESILNGTDPILKDELIPVTISDDGTVRKADLGSKWYSYEEKIWANAVILKDETKDYKATEIIPEENIESYFVWIPKYRYQLWDLGLYDSLTSIDASKVHEIPVIFGDYNTSDNIEGECTTPMESGASGNCNVGDYMTHPAFLSIPSKGFWVGKFETGYDGAATSDDAKVNVNDPSKIIIKPNVYSWRRIKIANAFYSSYDYKRNLDSHMMKNTEWGAVAYLQHSKYGSGTSVRINNNSSFLTGYQANNEPTCGDTRSFLPDAECSKNCLDNTCNKAYPNSNLASSTNNISGIFDMSGGSLEYMMAFVIDDNNNIIVGSDSSQFSGFNGNLMNGDKITNGLKLPSSKYYDMYHFEIDNAQAFNYRILGDATGEGGPFSKIIHIENHYVHSGSWYNDSSNRWFTTQYNFFQRSAAYYSGYNAGVFATTVYYGSEIWDCSFRLILSPT